MAADLSKAESHNEEKAEHVAEQPELSEAHREYLLQKHGTLDLDPLPHMDDADPLNWSSWKKIVNIALVSFHAMMATLSAAAVQAAFVPIAEDLHISVPQASYLVSLFIAVLGGAPLFWRPLAQTYGRRPVFIASLVCSLIGNVGCAKSGSYGTMCLCRAITAFAIAPPGSIGSAVVSEMFFRQERGRYMGIWTTMVTLGVPLAAFLFGFLAEHAGYRWIYWTLAITNGVQLILYTFLGAETRYVVTDQRAPDTTQSSFRRQYFSFGRIDPAPITIWSFIEPLSLALRPCVMIPAAAYAMVFLWGSVFTTFEIPQIYPEIFEFNTQQVGYQFASVLIGTIIGEQLGGLSSDKWMYLRRRKTGVQPANEYRLWLSYIGFALTIVGIVIFMVQLDGAKEWDVTPLVGAGIAAAGNQIVTTILITYACDCFPLDAAAIGVFIIFVRQMWGFIGPFWFPPMVENLGLTKSVAIVVVTVFVAGIVPTALLQLLGKRWHGRDKE